MVSSRGRWGFFIGVTGQVSRRQVGPLQGTWATVPKLPALSIKQGKRVRLTKFFSGRRKSTKTHINDGEKYKDPY